MRQFLLFNGTTTESPRLPEVLQQIACPAGVPMTLHSDKLVSFVCLFHLVGGSGICATLPWTASRALAEPGGARRASVIFQK